MGRRNYIYEIELVHKDTIMHGDTIICEDGFIRTVCYKNITYSSFTGVNIFGNSYACGYKKVKKVIFFNPLEKPKKKRKIEELTKEEFDDIKKMYHFLKGYKGKRITFKETKNNTVAVLLEIEERT